MILFAHNLAIILSTIIFAYLSWRKIEHGIMAIIFFLPAYLLRLNILGIPSTALEIGIYILFIIWLVKNNCDIFCNNTPSNSPYKGEDKKQIPLLLGEVRRGIVQQKLNLIKKEKTLFFGIFLLLFGAAMATLLSVDLRTSAGILKGWFFDPLLFFTVLVSVIKNSSQAENALKVFSLSGLAVAAVSLFYWLGFLPNGVSYDGRLYGIYASPNYLAMYLATPFIISIWLFFLSLRSSSSVQLRINSSGDEVMPPADPPKADNLADGAIDTGLLHPSADGLAIPVKGKCQDNGCG